MHARPMGAGRRLAREQQTLTNRRSKSVNILGRRPKGDVAVRSQSKWVTVPCRHPNVGWWGYIRAEYVSQDLHGPSRYSVVRPALDRATLIAPDYHHQNRFPMC